jgi:stage V sporulation protein G
MEITEVRIKLTEDSDDRLQAFCSITFDDCFVVRDLKIIEGTNGPFVAMPSRKLTSHCPRCGCKNHLRASYCNQCGSKLNPDRAARDTEGRAKLYADIAHPINSTCREAIQERVIEAYQQELELAKQPGYVSRYDDDYEDDFSGVPLGEAPAAGGPSATPPKDKTIQRADPATSTPEPPPPHTGKMSPPERPPESTPEQSTPHSHLRRKPGFGAGILDE